jgi:SRSO17 transposase
MEYAMDLEAEGRLRSFFDEIGAVLGNGKQRASFAMYAMGLLGDGDRKSVEPIAARACADPDKIDALHQRLLHFLVDANWSDREVRRTAARHAVGVITERDPIVSWPIDDTGFLKQGKHSVGVQRQYTGSAGKVANCQCGVSLTLATARVHVPVDFELYLPRSWTDDPDRRAEARIPDDIKFKTKPELALDMIDRALADGLPRGVVLADSAFGDSSDFREELRCRGLDYAVGIKSPTKVWLNDGPDAHLGKAVSVATLARRIDRKQYRRVTWRDGTRRQLSSHFAMRRVISAKKDGWDPAEREDVWLLIEWPEDEPEPTKYFLTTMAPNITKKQLVRMVKERYRTEQVYQECKGELGLDHYEGRRFSGWHHHVSVALCCYAFVVAERGRLFPPSTARPRHTDALPLAA